MWASGGDDSGGGAKRRCCSSGLQAAAEVPDGRRVRLACRVAGVTDAAGVSSRLDSVVLAAAEALHLWEGLVVELVSVPSVEAAAAAVCDASADFAYTSDLATAGCYAAWQPLKVVCAGLLQPVERVVQAASGGSGQPCELVGPAGVLVTSAELEQRSPDACLRLARAFIRASRYLHEDRQLFHRVAQSWTVASLSEEDTWALWQALVHCRAFAVNGGTSRSHWGPRLEALSAAAAGAPEDRSLTYEGLVSCASTAAALSKLGRHPGAADPV